MTEPTPDPAAAATDQQAARPPRRRAKLGADFSMDQPTAPLATGRPDEDAAAPAQPAAPPPAAAPAQPPQQPTAPAPEPEPAPPPAQPQAAAPTRRPATRRRGASGGASKRASKGAPVHPDQQATTQATTQAGSVLRTQLMRGQANPYNNVGQSGVRLPLFLRDALRTKVALSQGEWNTQRLVSEAVEWFLVEALGDEELVEEAWTTHGGPAGLREEHRPR